MADFYASYPFEGAISGSGTVTSVGLADGSSTPIYNISGSPVTTSGTLTFSLKTENANKVFAGPSTGIDAQPTFRTLVAADFPTGNLTDTGTDGIVVTGGTGAVIGAGTSLAQHVADISHNGYLSSTDWNTFNNKQAALTIGNLTDVGTDGIIITGGSGSVIGSGTSIAQHVADSTHNGYLSSTDWSTFNSKGSGSVTSVGMTVPTFLSVSGSPVTTSGTLAVSLSGTALPIANGGTGVTSVTTAPAATTFVGWDANKNISSNSSITAYTTTATAAGTTTLTVGSTYQQYFTGSTTQTVVLPVTSTLVLGQQFAIANKSSGVVTVQSSGANTIQAMAANTIARFTCILTSGTTAASWSTEYLNASSTGTVTSVALTVPTFLSVSGSPITTSGTLAVTLSGTALPVLNGGTGVTTSTGSGNTVLSTSPTLVTPVLGTPTSGNLSNCTSYPNVTQSVAGLVASAGQLLGTNTNDTASSGNVGQYIENNAAAGSASLTSGTNREIDSGGGSPVGITLGAGCWDIQATIVFSAAATTSVTRLECFIGTATGDNVTGQDLTRNAGAWASSAGTVIGTNAFTLITPVYRVNLSGNTTYYNKSIAIFTVSTMTAGGTIRGTRIR